MIRRFTLAASLAAMAMAVPVTGHAEVDFDPECGRPPAGKPIHAEFTQPEDGKLVVQHQGGTVSLGTGDPAGVGTGVMVSTTGTIAVEIAHGCVDFMHLTVKKDGSPIHDQDFDVTCPEQTSSTTVNIGLDAGEYTFHLSGSGCNAKPLLETSDGHYVGDPPLPL
jgi:hypothetical protein